MSLWKYLSRHNPWYKMTGLQGVNVKQIFTSLGNVFFTLYGKQFFTSYGKFILPRTLRLGINGLAQVVGTKYDLNPFEKGTLFLFCGRRMFFASSFWLEDGNYCGVITKNYTLRIHAISVMMVMAHGLFGDMQYWMYTSVVPFAMKNL